MEGFTRAKFSRTWTEHRSSWAPLRGTIDGTASPPQTGCVVPLLSSGAAPGTANQNFQWECSIARHTLRALHIGISTCKPWLQNMSGNVRLLVSEWNTFLFVMRSKMLYLSFHSCYHKLAIKYAAHLESISFDSHSNSAYVLSVPKLHIYFSSFFCSLHSDYFYFMMFYADDLIINCFNSCVEYSQKMFWVSINVNSLFNKRNRTMDKREMAPGPTELSEGVRWGISRFIMW